MTLENAIAHEYYDTRLSDSIARRRGAIVTRFSDKFLSTVPDTKLENSPQEGLVLDVSRYIETNTSIVIPTMDPEGNLILIKMIPRLQKPHPICTLYNTDKGRMEANLAALQRGNLLNISSPYLYNAQVLRYEQHTQPDGSLRTQLILAKPLVNGIIPDDPRFPVATVMKDLLFSDSMRDKLVAGETDYLGHVLPQALIALHRNSSALTPELARRYASFDVIRDIFIENFELSRKGLVILQEEYPEPGTFTSVWNPEFDKLYEDLFLDIFYRKRQFFEKMYEERIRKGWIKDNIHRDLKLEHILAFNKGVPVGSPMWMYLAVIDHVDFEELFFGGDVARDVTFLKNDIKGQATLGTKPVVYTLAEKVNDVYFTMTGQTNSISAIATSRVYDLEAPAIRVGIKGGLTGDLDGAIPFVRILAEEILAMREFIKGIPG